MTAPASATAALEPPAGREVARLRQMIRIRRLEERCGELYKTEQIRGFLHLYIGEEAVATGVMDALAPDDAVVATYREHGHALAKGVSARAIMAEMFGKAEGCAGGRGGSMHLFDRARRFFGGNAIVGGGLPMAVGLALADHMRHLPRVTACFFGDGAVAEGEFHESLNLASLWKLPVLFVCENNLYAMGTALARHQAQTDLTVKAAAYGLPSTAVDGMDVTAVADAAADACRSIRAGEGPVFLECRTYRFKAHSMFDPELYRDRAEVAQWMRQCPIATFTARLRERGLLDDAGLAAIERDAMAEVDDAVAWATAGTWEPIESLTRWVYSDARAAT